MDPEFLAQVLASAQRAIEEGGNASEVDAVIAENTGLPNFFALRMSVESARDAQEAELLGRVADVGVPANVAGQLVQGLTFGALDDFLDMIGESEAAESFRTGIEEGREAAPGGAMAANIAGGVLLPGAGGAQAASNISRRLGGGLLARFIGGTTGGTVGGAVGGGLFGVGEAEGPLTERIVEEGIPGAGRGALTGLVTGMAGGAAGAAAQRAFPRTMTRLFPGPTPPPTAGQTAASALTRRTQLPQEVNALRELARKGRQDVSNRFFRPLDRAHPEVTDPDILRILGEAGDSRVAQEVISGVSEEVATGVRGPSFSELQRIQRGFLDEGVPQAQPLLRRMEQRFEGLAEGNRAFFQVSSMEEALEIGLDGGGRFAGKTIRTQTPKDIDRALEILPPGAHDHFRAGLLDREIDKLVRGDATPKVLRELIQDANTDGRLRRMFPSNAAAEEFILDIQSQIPAKSLQESFVRLVIPGVLRAFRR